MDFKCKCDMRTKLVGDGCQKCNTNYALDLYPQPAEICDTLESCGFSIDQSAVIAADIVQPLMSYIRTLSDKIDEMAKVI